VRAKREDKKSMLFVCDFWTRWTHVWKCEWATSKKNIIKLKRAITVKDASYKMQKHFFLRRGELRLLIEDDPKVL